MCGLLCFPAVPPGLSMHECGAAGSASCRLACPIRSTIRHLAEPASPCLATSPLCPGCPSPPLLPVWMNVSSLTPWLLDFHTVQFSVSSGCFLFLNWPSFGCTRRQRVSTYTSILAGSLTALVLKQNSGYLVVLLNIFMSPIFGIRIPSLCFEE